MVSWRWADAADAASITRTHHASAENQTTADDVGRAGRYGGRRRDRLAEEQTSRWCRGDGQMQLTPHPSHERGEPEGTV